MVELMRPMLCLETAAHDVEAVLQQQRILRLPHVILVDSNYRPTWQSFNPSLADLKQAIAQLP
jgi:hypothetical protein